jgi:hypothetical protein
VEGLGRLPAEISASLAEMLAALMAAQDLGGEGQNLLSDDP